MIRPLHTILIVAVLLSTLTMISPVLACSGGATDTVEALLERTDIAVMADPVAVDELRQNGVLRVESYLYGSGPEYVLVSLNDPIILEAMQEGTAKRGCNAIEESLTADETGYFFLTRSADGVYRSTTYVYEPKFYTFENADSTVRYYTEGGEPYIEHILDEAAFVDLITTTGNSQVTAPDSLQPYPRLAPLNLVTADGKYYLLPVDQDTLLEVTINLLSQMTMSIYSVERPDWNEQYFPTLICPGDYCGYSSPDGQNFLSLLTFSNEVTWYSGIAPGQAFLFSSTSDAIAVWNQDQLTMYTMGYPRPDMNNVQSQEIRSVTLSGAPEQVRGQAAWSPDGRLLAYSDSAGLWLLDVFTPDAEPVLLAADVAVVPIVRGFSPLGRYLHLTQGDERYTLDRVSGARWPDGIISPDERLLLAFDTSAEVFTDMQLCPLLQLSPCEPVRGTSDNDTLYDQFIQATWRDNSSFLVSACLEADLADCVIDRHYSEYGISWRDSVYFTPGFAFDYQPQHDNLVIVQPNNHLLINGETVDLSASLTEPIIRVEWLPSLFYQR